MRGRFSGKVGSHSGLSLEGAFRNQRRFGTNGSHEPCSDDGGRENTCGVVEPSAEEPVADGLPAVHAASNTARTIGEARVILASKMGYDDGRRQ